MSDKIKVTISARMTSSFSKTVEIPKAEFDEYNRLATSRNRRALYQFAAQLADLYLDPSDDEGDGEYDDVEIDVAKPEGSA